MASRREKFLPREGLYLDPIAVYFRKLFMNPWIMGTILVASKWRAGRYDTGQTFSQMLDTKTILQMTTGLLGILGALFDINDFLDREIHNNWVKDKTWDWRKEIVLVTGGSSGIGASVVQQLVEKNSQTTIVVLDYAPLAFKIPLGAPVHYYQCDLSRAEEIKTICARIRAEVGDPSVVLNNAGLSRGATVMEGSYGDIEVTVRTNLIAPFLILKEFLPAMVRKNHGHIIATSSMSSVIPPAGLADYAATKAGLATLHQALAQELEFKLKAPKVRLSVVTLSFIATPMFKGRTNQSEFITPLVHVDTVGEKIVDILYSGYGKNIYLPGLMRYITSVRGAPDWLGRIVANQTRSYRWISSADRRLTLRLAL